jgi:cytoskeletal protein CcmA (bactofilin family)
MFGKKKRDISTIATLVGEGTTVSGNLAFRGRLHLDGVIEGDVSGEVGASVLAIGTDGVIEGAVQVDELVLNGTVRGDVLARERVELGPTARVDGNVAYTVLQMSAGACVNGRLLHQPGGQQALPAPEGDVSPGVG